MKKILLTLMVFGIVGCATNIDGKLVSNFKTQTSHNVNYLFGEEILSSYDDITLRHKVLTVNLDTYEEFFFASGIDVKTTTNPANNNTRKYALDLCEWYAEPKGYKSKLSGKCVILKVDGNEYSGSYRNGEFHGRGTYTFANGDKYIGGFKNGMFNGQGTMYWADGKELSGNFYYDRFIKEPSYNSNISYSKILGDVITTTGQIILGGLYIAVAVAGSPEALEYQENKNQKAREEAAYKKGKRDGAIRAERKKSEQCVVTRSC
jgi:hypothetical protein